MQKKKWVIGITIGAAVVLFAAGIIYYLSRFDPVAYTQEILDVSYKNLTENYIEQTGEEEAETMAVFEQNLDTIMAQFTTVELGEDLEKEYRNLFERIMKQVKYTVGRTVKKEDGSYTVSVQVEPILLFDDTYDEFQIKAQEYATSISNSVMAGEEMPSEEEMQRQLYYIYYEILAENLENNLQYGEPETVELHIDKQNLFTYEIREEDLQKLEELLISKNKLKE